MEAICFLQCIRRDGDRLAPIEGLQARQEALTHATFEIVDNRCADWGRKAGVKHQNFLIAANVDGAKRPVQERRVSFALCREEWHLIGLDKIPSRLNIADEREIFLPRTEQTPPIHGPLEQRTEQLPPMTLESCQFSEVGLDVETNSVPAQTLVARPRVEGCEASCSLGSSLH